MHLSLLSSSISACTVICLVQIRVFTLPVCLSKQWLDRASLRVIYQPINPIKKCHIWNLQTVHHDPQMGKHTHLLLKDRTQSLGSFGTPNERTQSDSKEALSAVYQPKESYLQAAMQARSRLTWPVLRCGCAVHNVVNLCCMIQNMNHVLHMREAKKS